MIAFFFQPDWWSWRWKNKRCHADHPSVAKLHTVEHAGTLEINMLLQNHYLSIYPSIHLISSNLISSHLIESNLSI